MPTIDPNNPDTTVAVQASAWLRIGEVLQEAHDIIEHFYGWGGWGLDDPIAERKRAARWLEEYDAHQIPTQEPQP